MYSIFDHERLDVYRLAIDYVTFSSMLTGLIQRTESVEEGSIEYEYRCAEYEYEKPQVYSRKQTCHIYRVTLMQLKLPR